jgi:hypothetical protein
MEEARSTVVEADEASLLTICTGDEEITARASTPGQSRSLAEALHEARPRWRLSIGGSPLVFSREGRIVDAAPKRVAG